ncbi:secreted RxLR effector protein 161-like [Nicotiana sylvestris]|uniref:secreted RxLR effector protein 161-like n=1 Tax=Nicotiana sylvestris TaxID=4096 RepID=UPI00388C8046
MVEGSTQLHEKLPFALLGYRTTIRTLVGSTPYLLVYGTEAVIPAEVEIPSPRILAEAKIDDDEWVKTRLEQLSLIDEKRLAAVCHGQLYQQRMTRSTLLESHLNLSRDQSPKTNEERKYMPKVPYASTVGSLMYVMVCTRPDIAHAVRVISRYMSDLGKEHWESVKWILLYLKSTTGTTLCFKKSNIILQGFADANLGRDLDSQKSTTGYVFTLGGTAVSWTFRLHKSVALSTIEVEYMAIS